MNRLALTYPMGALTCSMVLLVALAAPVSAADTIQENYQVNVEADTPSSTTSAMVFTYTWCDPLPTTINTSQPPFIFTGPRLECVTGILDE